MPNRTCTIGGCEDPHYGRGFCVKHYKADHYQRNKSKQQAQRSIYNTEHADEIKAYMADYYSKNRELIRTRANEWRKNNPEKKRQNDFSWVESNIDRKRQTDKKRWDANPVRNRKLHHAWYLKNKHAVKEASGRRRARKYSNGYERVDFQALLTEHGMFCHICKSPIAERSDLHFDHVIPLAKGGPHTADNIRPSHAHCNLSKGARILTN